MSLIALAITVSGLGLACELELSVEPGIHMGDAYGELPVDGRAFARVPGDAIGASRSSLELLVDGRVVAGTPGRVDLMDGTGALSLRPDAHLPAGVPVTARLTVGNEVVDERELLTHERLADTLSAPRLAIFEVVNIPEAADELCVNGVQELAVTFTTGEVASDVSVVEVYVVNPGSGLNGDPDVVAVIAPDRVVDDLLFWTRPLGDDPMAPVCVVAVHVDAAGGRTAVTTELCTNPTTFGDASLNTAGASCDYVGLTATPWAWLLLLFARRRKS